MISSLIGLVIGGGLITAIATIVCQVLINKDNEAKRKDDNKARQAVLDVELKSIKDRLDTHNHYAEKIGGIESSLALMQQDIKYLKEGKFSK